MCNPTRNWGFFINATIGGVEGVLVGERGGDGNLVTSPVTVEDLRDYGKQTEYDLGKRGTNDRV